MITVYLDTSDLSCLAKRSGPGGPALWTEYRDRLEPLLRRGTVHLRVSLVHFYEIAANTRTTEAVLEALGTGIPIWCATVPPDPLFRAELADEAVSMQCYPMTLADVRAIPGQLERAGLGHLLRSGPDGLHGQLKAIAEKEKSSRDAQRAVPPGVTKQTHRASQRKAEERARDVVRDRELITREVEAIVPGAIAQLEAAGHSLDTVGAAMGLVAEGCGWIPLLQSGLPLVEAVARAKNPRQAPASAMRIAITRENLKRDPRASARPDVMHLVYATRCAIATIDGDNMTATANVRGEITTQFFNTGNLAPVLNALEAEPV